jgi:hypothetical protein
MRVGLNASLVTDDGPPYVVFTFPASDGDGEVEVCRMPTNVAASDPQLPESPG